MKINKAFTLVELTVVITILIILWLISFISLQNYTKEARDSKRISDIKSLLTKLNLEETKWTPYEDLLTDTETHEVTINWKKYLATQWIINFELLKENKANFIDPEYSTDYEFATVLGTTEYNWKEEKFSFIQGRTINERDWKIEVVLWNYYEYQPWIDSPNLFTWSLNISIPNYNCDPIPPSIANIDTIIWIPTEINQQWQNTNANKACYYKCNNTHTWNNDKTICEKLDYYREYTAYGQCDASSPNLWAWSACSKDCWNDWVQTRTCDEKTWNKTRTAVCINSNLNQQVNDSFCDSQNWLTKEQLTTNCTTELCNTPWYEKTQECNRFSCSEDWICWTSNNTNATTAPTWTEACTKWTIANLAWTWPWTWICSWEHWWDPSPQCATNAFCATQPNYPNADFTPWTPTKANQAWVKGWTWWCSYVCKENYSWENCENRVEIEVPPVEGWTLERKHTTHTITTTSDYVDVKYSASTHSGLDYYYSLGTIFSELNYIKLKFTAAYWWNGYYSSWYHNDGFAIVPCVRNRTEAWSWYNVYESSYYYSRSIPRTILGVPFLRYATMSSSFSESLYKTYEIEFNFKTLEWSTKVDWVNATAVDIANGIYWLMNAGRTYVQWQNWTNIFLNKFTKISQANYANDNVCLNFSMSDYAMTRYIRIKDFEILELY